MALGVSKSLKPLPRGCRIVAETRKDVRFWRVWVLWIRDWSQRRFPSNGAGCGRAGAGSEQVSDRKPVSARIFFSDMTPPRYAQCATPVGLPILSTPSVRYVANLPRFPQSNNHPRFPQCATPLSSPNLPTPGPCIRMKASACAGVYSAVKLRLKRVKHTNGSEWRRYVRVLGFCQGDTVTQRARECP